MIEYVSFGATLPTGSYGAWTELPLLLAGTRHGYYIEHDEAVLTGLSGFNSSGWADIRMTVNDRETIRISTSILESMGHLLALRVLLRRGDRIRVFTTTSDDNMYVSAVVQLQYRR